MRRTSKFLGLTTFISLGFKLTLEAQHENRSLSGIDVDRHHETLRGAIVQVHNLETQTIVSYITGRNGECSFKRLDGDSDCKISATWHDQRSSAKNITLFDCKRAKVSNLIIKS